MSKEELNCLSAGLGCCSCNLPRQPLSEAVSLAVLGARCFHHVLVHLHSKILKICLPWPHSLQSIVLVTESKSHHHVLNCLLFASLAFPAGDGSRAACTAGCGQAAARFGNVVTPEGPSAAMPGTAQGSTGCSVPSTPSSWVGVSVSRRALWGFHLCGEVPPALRLQPDPKDNYCNLLFPLLLVSGLSHQHKFVVPLLHPLVLCPSSCCVDLRR